MGLLAEKIVQVFMKNSLKLFVLIGAIVLIGCSMKVDETPLPFYNSPDFSPEWIKTGSEKFDNIHKISSFKFHNQLGNEVDNKLFEGKIYAANFFFTICPSICLKMTDNLKQVQDAFEKDDDVLLLSHTVMPWVDSIPKLHDYAKHKEVLSNKWHLVTGDKSEIYDLARNSYFAEKELGLQKDSKEFLHTENVILVDQKGRIRGVYNGTLPLEMKRLIEDIKLLKRTG